MKSYFAWKEIEHMLKERCNCETEILPPESEPVKEGGNNYFNLSQELVASGLVKNYGDFWYNTKGVFCYVGRRRTGKSTSIYLKLDWLWTKSNYTRKAVYIRNSMEEIKKFSKSFNSFWKDKRYQIIDNSVIYKMYYDENGKEVIKNRILIGYLVSLSTYQNNKSIGNIEGVSFVVWDEFNGYEDGKNTFDDIKSTRTQFFYFLELLASFESTGKDLIFFLFGNKVNAQNDILMKFNVKIPKESEDNDIWYQCDIKDFEGKDWPVRICLQGKKSYQTHYGNLLSRALATLDPQLNAYFVEGDFYQEPDESLITERELLSNDLEVINYFVLKENLIEFGMYDKDKWYMRLVAKAHFDDIEKISLDIRGFSFIQESSSLSLKELKKICLSIVELIKTRRLYFTSVWLKNNLLKFAENMVLFDNL